MNHKGLCYVIYNKIILCNYESQIIRIIDKDKYYNIFSYQISPEEYDYHPLKNIYNHLSRNIIDHIIMTRKIIIYNEITKLTITDSLRTTESACQFFSRYTVPEIIVLLSGTCENAAIYYDGKYMRCALIFVCLYYTNIHKKTDPTGGTFISYATIVNKNHINYDVIPKHEKSVVFGKSLRATWIMACIIIY